MKKYTEQMVKALTDLLKIPTLKTQALEGAPFGEGNRKALDYVLDLCASLGFKTKNVDGYCGWAEVGEGELVGVVTHLDVVPYGEGWDYSPLGEIVEKDGQTIIYGRGTEDDKGPAVASVYALASLLADGFIPKKRVRLIFCCNEESGWKCIDYYKEHEEIPVISFSPDADFPVIRSEKRVVRGAITIAKPETVESITAGEVGFANIVPNRAEAVLNTISDVALMYALHHGVTVKKEGEKYRLTATGKAAHGSTPQLGENALSKILNTVISLSPALASVALALTDYTGKGCGLDICDDSGAMTINVGVAKTYEDKIEFHLDIRCPISSTAEAIAAKFKLAMPDAEVDVDEAHPPVYFAEDHPLITLFLDSYEAVMGDRPAPDKIGGATFARAFPNSVSFGPVFPGNIGLAHQANEHVVLDEYIKSAEIYKEAIKRLAF